MVMYSLKETNLSQNHLQKLSEGVTDDIYLLGGWAVHYNVNPQFQNIRRREYIGSRDIDIGFHFKEEWGVDDLRTCAFQSCISELIGMGFQWQGFRLFKDFDYDTLRELSVEESASRSFYEFIRMYVDPIVDYVHPSFNEVCGYDPIDEPLLKLGFDNNWFVTHNKFDNVKVTEPHLLLAMKMNSVLQRDKDDKRIKDISDIFALMWHSPLPFDDIKFRFNLIYEKTKLNDTISKFKVADIDQVSSVLGIPSDEINAIFSEFIK